MITGRGCVGTNQTARFPRREQAVALQRRTAFAIRGNAP